MVDISIGKIGSQDYSIIDFMAEIKLANLALLKSLSGHSMT